MGKVTVDRVVGIDFVVVERIKFVEREAAVDVWVEKAVGTDDTGINVV